MAKFVEALESRTLLAADVSILKASTANLAATSGNKTGAITIKNSGKEMLSGTVDVTFIATAGNTTQTLGSTTITLSSLKPKSTQVVSNISLTAPTNSGAKKLAFNITAKITAHTTPAETVTKNNSKSAGKVTIQPGSGGSNPGGGTSTGDGLTVFGSASVGTVLKFKKTGSLPGNGIHGFVNETGTFTDDKGNHGTYQLTIPPNVSAIQPPQLLGLDFKNGIQRQYTLTFTPISKRLSKGLNNKTVTFGTSSTGTAAKGTILSTFLPTIYLKY